ncbi:MAG TPA: ImmA/IrrE family metallo-endopeptidase [Ignavibacteria bacterium]|nr:ImmA/IrrE family metallo-endopeptidase [Ignavibacteria bacterium]
MLKLTEINTNILEWALNYSAQGIEVETKFPKLNSWLKKDDFPTVRQLEKFAKATRVPFGYFFLEKEPEITLPIPFFRTIKEEYPTTYSPELIDAVKIVEQRRIWLSDFLIQSGADKFPFVGSEENNSDYRDIAKKIKSVLGLNDLWASNQSKWDEALNFLIEKIESIGINIIRNGVVGNNTHRKLNFQEFRGFALVDDYAPFLFLNGADYKSAQIFTLVHELAHIWLGSSAVFDLRQMLPAEDKTEILCNKVAAEFLVPEKQLRENWKSFQNADDFYQSIAKFFKVSKIVAARRLLDLDYINKQEFFDFYSEYIASIPKGKKEKGGGNYYNTQPLRIGKRFANVVITATKRGTLLYRDAYRLTGLTASTFNEFENKFYKA